MENDRQLQPVKSDYVEALGLAAFCFSSCEWQVAWCCEKIRPGAINKIVGGEKTAGEIAKTFIDLARNMPRSKERDELSKLAKDFSRLVTIRNGIIHGKPCTGPNGEARLSGLKVIEINDLEDAADAFTACGAELNNLYYGFLAQYIPP